MPFINFLSSSRLKNDWIWKDANDAGHGKGTPDRFSSGARQVVRLSRPDVQLHLYLGSASELDSKRRRRTQRHPPHRLKQAQAGTQDTSGSGARQVVRLERAVNTQLHLERWNSVSECSRFENTTNVPSACHENIVWCTKVATRDKTSSGAK